MNARIGLMGVPGAGKTKLANAVKRALPEYKFIVCDKYAEKIGEEMDMQIGIEATYLPNLHIATKREQEVRKLVLEEKNYILCGTTFDTLCYAGFHAEVLASSAGDQEKKTGLLMREMTAAQLFAYMAIDLFSFTHVFYLPVTDPDLLVVIPYETELKVSPEMQALDKTLQDALRRYGNPATMLNDKHHKNVQAVVNAIKSEKNGTGPQGSLSGERTN